MAQSGVVAIDAERSTALALKADGSLVEWGYGGAVPPTGLTGISQIAVSSFGGMAVKSDHTIHAWGVSGAGVTEVPDAVQGHAVSIAAGNQFALAVTDTGWGAVVMVPRLVLRGAGRHDGDESARRRIHPGFTAATAAFAKPRP